MRRKTVEFDAIKTVKEPTEVRFKTKSGTRVDFEASKPVKKKVHVEFLAKRNPK